jgi:hypothetical protein
MECIGVHSTLVMPGLDPGIHVFVLLATKDVDGRDKPGHDDLFKTKILVA